MPMAEDIKQWRKALRAELLARRLAESVAVRRHWSMTIAETRLADFRLLQTTTLGFYSPFRGEVDVRAAVRQWRRRGTVTALPVVVGKGAPLEFREWKRGVRMVKGIFDVAVPEGTAVVRPTALLIPPVAFDEQGYRLGYGGGYYDRTLASLSPQPLKIAVAFELSRIETIRPQSHDIRMDFIVTEAAVYRVGATGLEALIGSQRSDALAAALGAGAEDEPIECASPPCYAHEIDPSA